MVDNSQAPFLSCHLLTSLGRAGGGIPPAVRGLVRAEASLGVASLALGGFPADDWGDVPHRALLPCAPRMLGCLAGLKNELSLVNPDILHVHGLWQQISWAAAGWSRAHHRPVVVHPHGMLDSWALNNAKLKKWLAWWLWEFKCLTSASCIRALAIPELEAIRATGLRGVIAVIPNGVSLPDLNLVCASPPWSLKRAAGRKILLFLGRIHPKKGIEPLIRAWSREPLFAKEWYLVIAGWDNGGHRAYLELEISLLKVGDSVEFIGPCNGASKDAAFRNSSAFVLTSLSEGLPVAILEAWSYSLPVIMTEACNLDIGFIVGAALKSGYSDLEIGKCLSQLVRMSDADRIIMGANGRCLVEAEFSWEKIARRFHGLYSWMQNGGIRPEYVCE